MPKPRDVVFYFLPYAGAKRLAISHCSGCVLELTAPCAALANNTAADEHNVSLTNMCISIYEALFAMISMIGFRELTTHCNVDRGGYSSERSWKS